MSDQDRTSPQLVTAEWLSAHLEDPDVRVYDTTVHLSLGHAF